MKTRLLALLLCAIMLVPLLSSCSTELVESQMQIYISHQFYDLDPLNAYTDDAQLKVISMIFSGLFKIDENGKVTEDLVKSYEVKNDERTDEYTLTLTLKDTCWSDGSSVTADDVIYTFERVIKSKNSNDAAAMLMKIKNAKYVKSGESYDDSTITIADFGVSAIDTKVVQISFEEPITNEVLDEFKLSLTSPALYPLRQINVDGKEDWAKKPTSMTFSGPFLVRKVSYERGKEQLLLERNPYYYRNREKDAEDKYVTPYKIYVNYSISAEEQLGLYDNGQNLFVGEIPLSLRNQYASSAKITDLLSTHTYYFNQNALIASKKAGEEDGVKLFANANVRKALSLAIDRTAIAEMVVFAKPATGLLTDKMFATTSAKTKFRSKSGDILQTGSNPTEVSRLLSEAGINPSDYSFSISVREADEVHIAIAEAVAASWNALGFEVTVNPVGIIVNDDKDKYGGDAQTDIRDDLFDEESVRLADFEVLGVDLVAKSPSAFSVLAPFALDFTGNQTLFGAEIRKNPHFTGYNSETYNKLINEAFAATGDERTQKLVEAEKLLLNDAVVMPIVFNQSAVLVNNRLKNLSQSYYGFYVFTKVYNNNWAEYNDIYFPETEDELLKEEPKTEE